MSLNNIYFVVTLLSTMMSNKFLNLTTIVVITAPFMGRRKALSFPGQLTPLSMEKLGHLRLSGSKALITINLEPEPDVVSQVNVLTYDLNLAEYLDRRVDDDATFLQANNNVVDPNLADSGNSISFVLRYELMRTAFFCLIGLAMGVSGMYSLVGHAADCASDYHGHALPFLSL
ncbi:hypothetical protein DXG01_015358 [Tephrocybe rancida]|nr:hypothetical protein DXG01_015358 [Tephrocybe rancida]